MISLVLLEYDKLDNCQIGEKLKMSRNIKNYNGVSNGINSQPKTKISLEVKNNLANKIFNLGKSILYVKVPLEITKPILEYIFTLLNDRSFNLQKKSPESINYLIIDLESLKIRPSSILRTYGSNKLKELDYIDHIIIISHKNKIINSTLSYITSRYISKPKSIFSSFDEAMRFLKGKF